MQYLSTVRSLENQFKRFTLQHIERDKNEEADMLAKAAAKGDLLPSDVSFHTIGTPAVRNPEGLQITQDPNGRRIVHYFLLKDTRNWRLLRVRHVFDQSRADACPAARTQDFR
jgi:hypothetical protein